MSEKQRLKLPVWLQEPFTEEENRVLNKAYVLMTVSCLLGVVLMFSGFLFNLPFVLRGLGETIHFGCWLYCFIPLCGIYILN